MKLRVNSTGIPKRKSLPHPGIGTGMGMGKRENSGWAGVVIVQLRPKDRASPLSFGGDCEHTGINC